MCNSKNVKTAVALGTFDGLHKGHLAVINKAVIQKDNGLLPCVLLFSEHPQEVLSSKPPKMLMTNDMRQSLIKSLGCESRVISFREICNMTAEEFVSAILKDRLGAAFVSCGFNFRFGKNGMGDTTILKELCKKHNIELSVADEVDFEGKAISSTEIRKAIENGETEKAASMLGRLFSYDFTVEHGDERGRTLGFPTVNQFFPKDFIVPRFGVYASVAKIDGNIYPAVTNIGNRPTIGTMSVRSETNIMGFKGDLYGQRPQIALIRHLRDEIKFNSLKELKDQIDTDSKKALIVYGEKKWELS